MPDERTAALRELEAAVRRNGRSEHPDLDLRAAWIAYNETPQEDA